jgi:hypothetical protein
VLTSKITGELNEDVYNDKNSLDKVVGV